MTKEERETVYKTVIEKWGEKAQLEMAQEEATEMALAVRKFIRKQDDASYANLIEEIADVEIMIGQIKFMFKDAIIHEIVEQQKDFKLNRVMDRIKNNSFE